MGKKKPPNWEEIETRYTVDGEKPSDIAKDYNVTAKRISDVAWERGWGEQRRNIGRELQAEAIHTKKKLIEEAHEIYGVAFAILKKHFIDAQNPLLFDGEGRINPLFLEPMKVAGKMVSGEEVEDEETGSKIVEVEGMKLDSV